MIETILKWQIKFSFLTLFVRLIAWNWCLKAVNFARKLNLKWFDSIKHWSKLFLLYNLLILCLNIVFKYLKSLLDFNYRGHFTRSLFFLNGECQFNVVCTHFTLLNFKLLFFNLPVFFRTHYSSGTLSMCVCVDIMTTSLLPSILTSILIV